MEEFHSNWFNKSNGLSKASFRSSDSFFATQPFDREKWAASSENVLSFPTELSQRPNLSHYDSDRYGTSHKEEDNFLLTPNKADMKYEYNPQENQESGNVERPIQLDELFGGSRMRKMEDFRQDYYHIRRSRGVSFLSEQEGVDHEHAKNQEFDFMRYFSNHGNHDIGSPKGQPKTEPDTNFMEEEDHTLNLGAFPIHNTLRDLTHCFQPKDLHQVLLENTENIINIIPAPQNQEAADQKSVRKFEELKSEPRKKRKLNNSKTVIEPKKEEGAKSLKVKKSKSLAGKKSSMAASTAESTQPEKSQLQIESPQNQQKMETSPKDANTNPESVKIETTSSLSKDVKSETSVPLVNSKSLEIPSGDPQIKRTDSLGRLFQGFELPAEVEEFIGKSKIFSSLQQFVTKKIGPLTREERQVKVERYLEKRKGRTWCKKINYDCRKKVAEARLRLKGRFVTKAQAFTMLQEEGIKYNPNEITDSEIKELLERILENKKIKNNGSKKVKESKAKKVGKSKVKMENIDQGMTQTPSERNEDYTQSATDEGQEEFY